MEVYTNSKTVKELITSQTNIELEPFDSNIPTGADLFILDDGMIPY